MSQLNDFIQHVQQKPDLRERLKGAENDEVLVERVLAEGQALGYDLDADEVRQRMAATQDEAELSEADLELVSGAGSWPGTCGSGTVPCVC